MRDSFFMKDSSEINLNGEKFIPAGDAGRLCNYTRIYVGQLCRSGKINCKKFGTDWMVSEKSILAYKKSIFQTQEEKQPEVVAITKQTFHPKDYSDEWDKAILGETQKKEFRLEIPFPKFSPKQWLLGTASILTVALIFWNADSGVIRKNLAALSLPEFSLPEISIPNISLPPLPFSLDDIRLSVFDLKNRFQNNLFAWRDFARLAARQVLSLGLDIKKLSQNLFLISPSPEPSPQVQPPRIITFPAESPPTADN